MNPEKLKQTFDHQAPSYDQQWAKMAPIRDCMHLLLDAAFAGLPEAAQVLCVGAGTGAELSHFARAFPGWRFLALDPSGPMLEICRERAAREGFLERCRFHEGYLDTLDPASGFDAATCFLVSHFMLDQEERRGFFRAIAGRLKSGGLLASSDLCADIATDEYAVLLEDWFRLMRGAGMPPDGVDRMRAAYAKDVAILPPSELDAIVLGAGFGPPAHFFQAGLIRAWHARKA
jgi:tRNA (cmo5U34)-methyltransferase